MHRTVPRPAEWEVLWAGPPRPAHPVFTAQATGPAPGFGFPVGFSMSELGPQLSQDHAQGR